MTLPELLSVSPPGQVDKLAKEFSSLGLNISSEGIERIKQEASITESSIVDHPLAQAIQKELQIYRDEHYASLDHYYLTITQPKGTSNGNILKLVTYAERVDEPNYYSGSWRGEWTIEIPPSDDDTLTLEGSVQIHIYCHENCNVQLETKKTCSKTTVRNNYSVAKSIKNKIASFESEVQMNLREQIYSTMDDKLKALRRILPVMRTRMEWNVLSHRMVKKLEESAPPAK
mmetsp:Transcript_2461/g.3759  ORF Transcript_2461/g.3759 Transcript_2461/m.3759 type:complete len:230 (+) Transcript_2461:88-777(+)